MPIRCSQCGSENREGRRFCSKCGASLSASCASCGFVNDPNDRFCGGCGVVLRPAAPSVSPVPERNLASYTPKHLAEKILRARSALEGERRQVTVLFADIAGFTKLAEARDPEEVHAIIDRCFEAITAEVHRFEGTINQYTGDGVMALFGAPVAHEDSPRRAVHAALGIQRALREHHRTLQAEKGVTLQMRIGINTGLVVVGRIGDDLRMDYTAVGDTTNLAARLQQNARPGSVLVSEATFKRISGYFETLDMDTLAVKGHAPVRAYEVLRPRRRSARFDPSVERGLTPLVARARELDTLAELFGKVKRGEGQVVCIVGDAGIGKSRLVLEFRKRLAQRSEDVTWLEGRCVSFGQSIPFLPLLDQFRENFGIEEFDGEPEIIAKVEHGLRRMREVDAHIPHIRYLLAVDPGDPAITAVDAAARRKQMLEAARSVALRGARIRPIVFVFEDLHWLDTSTEEYLGSLMDSVAGAAVMLIMTHRFGYTLPFGTRSFSTTLTLHGLSETDALTMAGRVLGSTEFPIELKTALMEKAEGVPLFVEEVTKTLLDLGVLRRKNGGYEMVRQIAEVNVPDTIEAIIMARLDRLGDDGKRTVQLASVIGRQFLRRLLERLSDLPGQLEGLLTQLKALEIIYERDLLPEPSYIFKHAVIQDVAYNSLLVQRRKELHRAVGDAIEELYPDRLAEHYEELAHHFRLGADWRKALHYSSLAGDRAAHTFANAESRRHYDLALDALRHVTPVPDLEIGATLHAKQAAVLNLMAEYEAAVGEYEKALAIAKTIGKRNLEIEILVALAGVYNWSHKSEPALGAVNSALAIAVEIDDRASQVSCLAMRAEVSGAAYGAVLESTLDAEEAVRLAKEIGEPRLLARALNHAGRILTWGGDFDRAIGYLAEGTELARREYSGFLIGLGLYTLGHAYLAKADYEKALAHYRELSDYAAAAGDKLYIVRAPNCLGGVHLELFDLDGAIRFNEEGEETTKRLWPWPEPRGHALVKLALAHVYRGDAGRADAFLQRASDLLTLDPWGRWTWHSALLYAQGERALLEGKLDDAWKHATQSLDLASTTYRRKHLARAQRLQGEVLAATSRLDDAVRVLGESAALARAIDTPREVWLARAALGKVHYRMGRDKDAEVEFGEAARVIETIAAGLTTENLRRSFLNAERVSEVFRTLGRPGPS